MPDDRATALADLSRRLEAILGLAAVDRGVAERAAADPLFLHRLIAGRKDAEAVGELLASAAMPPPKWVVPASLRSVARAGVAIGRWAAAGFDPIDGETLRARVAACRRCPHLRSPGGMLQTLVAGRDGEVCGLCSCAVEKKAMLPTEVCPAPDPDRPDLSRWGEAHAP